jgi:DNA-binding transcriptional regulator GbsR (MarR family)
MSYTGIESFGKVINGIQFYNYKAIMKMAGVDKRTALAQIKDPNPMSAYISYEQLSNIVMDLKLQELEEAPEETSDEKPTGQITAKEAIRLFTEFYQIKSSYAATLFHGLAPNLTRHESTDPKERKKYYYNRNDITELLEKHPTTTDIRNLTFTKKSKSDTNSSSEPNDPNLLNTSDAIQMMMDFYDIRYQYARSQFSSVAPHLPRQIFTLKNNHRKRYFYKKEDLTQFFEKHPSMALVREFTKQSTSMEDQELWINNKNNTNSVSPVISSTSNSTETKGAGMLSFFKQVFGK